MEKIKSQTELEMELDWQRRQLSCTHVEAIINKYKSCEEEIINCIASDTYPREKAKIIIDIGKTEEKLENAIEEVRDKAEKELYTNINPNLEVRDEGRRDFLLNLYNVLNISNFIISEVTFSHKNYCLKPENLGEENRIFMEGCLSLAKEYELLRELKFELEKIEFWKEVLSDVEDTIEADYKLYRLFDLYNNLMDLFNLLNNKKVDLKLYELEEENINVVNIFNVLTDYSNISFT